MTNLTSARVFTSRDLLAVYLDLKGLQSDLRTWTEKGLASNPPRLIRFRRFRALLAAFGLPEDPEMFSSGYFIDAADPLYAALIPELVDMNDNSVGKFSTSLVDGSVRATFAPLQPEEFNGLPSLFRTLLAYRREVERCLQHTDGILEAPKIVWLGLTRVRHVNNAIRDVLEVIDEPLARLISPEDRSFTLEHLVEHHGYPTDDLDQIDWEWR